MMHVAGGQDVYSNMSEAFWAVKCRENVYSSTEEMLAVSVLGLLLYKHEAFFSAMICWLFTFSAAVLVVYNINLETLDSPHSTR